MVKTRKEKVMIFLLGLILFSSIALAAPNYIERTSISDLYTDSKGFTHLDLFAPRSTLTWEYYPYGYSSEEQKFYNWDGLVYSSNSNGYMEVEKFDDPNYKTKFGFCITGNAGGNPQKSCSMNYTWTWQRDGDVFTATNDDPDFIWQTEYDFNPLPNRMKITNTLLNNKANLNNAKMWYIFTLDNDVHVTYDGTSYDTSQVNDIHVNGDLNDKLAKLQFDGFNFNYDDILENFNVTDFYIGPATSVGYPEIRIVAVGFTGKTTSNFNIGQSVTVDPNLLLISNDELFGNLTYGYVNITNNAVLDIGAFNDSAGSGTLNITATYRIDVEDGATINGNHKGLNGTVAGDGKGTGKGNANADGGSGASYKGVGAIGWAGTQPDAPYGTNTTKTMENSSSGGGATGQAGGNAGGTLILTAPVVYVDGDINLLGQTAVSGGGSGAGGQFIVDAYYFFLRAVVRLIGGNGNGNCVSQPTGGAGGGGSGLVFSTIIDNSSGAINASAGTESGAGCLAVDGNVNYLSTNDTMLTPFPQHDNATTDVQESGTISSFSINATDDLFLLDIDDVWYESNYTGTMTNYSMSSGAGNKYTYTDIMTAGSFAYRFIVNNSIGLENATSQETFVVPNPSSSGGGATSGGGGGGGTQEVLICPAGFVVADITAEICCPIGFIWDTDFERCVPTEDTPAQIIEQGLLRPILLGFNPLNIILIISMIIPLLSARRQRRKLKQQDLLLIGVALAIFFFIGISPILESLEAPRESIVGQITNFFVTIEQGRLEFIGLNTTSPGVEASIG